MNRNTVNLTLTAISIVIAAIIIIKSINRADTMNIQADQGRRIHNLEIKVSDLLVRIEALEIKINNLNKAFNAVELYYEGQSVNNE